MRLVKCRRGYRCPEIGGLYLLIGRLRCRGGDARNLQVETKRGEPGQIFIPPHLVALVCSPRNNEQ